MAEEIGSIGARLDIAVRIGDTIGPYTVTLTDPDTGQALNLTGCTFEAALSKLGTADGDLPMTVQVVDAVNGVVKFFYAFASTASMTAAADGTFFKATDAYSWFFKYIDAGGAKQTIYYGQVKLAKGSPT